MANLTNKDVLKLASLAKLKLSESEITQFTTELDQILHYVEQLKDVDVSGLDPTNQVTGLSNVMRNDDIVPYVATPDALLENVPRKEKRFIKVKRVL
ncbi:MAG: aspartyl-tRNA(Asn)/glutamyl-tRNA(Gln) amidotransferase subunit [Patescibacteria group bacterium]|jgi:aspartyl-tRNA(Asn)/glutamyl-tRNA(Gln) amidotransferase subunit C|nr:aspartyl-tRNA(Asn)/glutamyl-tRNA(Gln) amidotransferase subunit [Patescibacteria group bacterium]